MPALPFAHLPLIRLPLIRALCLAAAALVTPLGAQAQDAAEPPAERQPGQTYIRAVHGDWEQRCVAAAPGAPREACQLYQLLLDEGSNPVAEISLFALARPQGLAVAGATIIVPLETLLTEELRMAIDGGDTRIYPYQWCSAEGCYARIGLTPEEIAAFRAGSEAQLAIVPAAAPDQIVGLSVSLSGFTAGYRALEDELAKE